MQIPEYKNKKTKPSTYVVGNNNTTAIMLAGVYKNNN